MAQFDKFTQSARRGLSTAQAEAQRLNHTYIGTEHLLLGLTGDADGVAARVLDAMGVQLPNVRSAVERIIGRGERAEIGDVGLTPRGRRVLELALDEARRLGHDYVGSEHLLLGLVREGEGIAFGVLESLGVDLEEARTHVRRLTGSGPASSARSDEIEPPPSADEPHGEATAVPKAGIFDTFDEQALLALTLARYESHRFNHNYIGTEHLLLGLVREGDGVAARVLGNMGVQLPKVRSAVEFIIGRGEGVVVGGIGLTPRAKKVLRLALNESRHRNHDYVGTEHLLLGIIREGEGIAAGVLESLGVDLEEVRRGVEDVTTGSTSQVEEAGPPEPGPTSLGTESQPGSEVEGQRSPDGGNARRRRDAVPKRESSSGEVRRLLELAADEARRLDHVWVGNGHLLLAIVGERDSVAARALRGLGVDGATVRSEVESIIGRGAGAATGKILRTARVMKVVELAIDEARRMNHRHLGSEHLLLGLARDDKGKASGVLARHGADLVRVRAQVEQIHHDDLSAT